MIEPTREMVTAAYDEINFVDHTWESVEAALRAAFAIVERKVLQPAVDRALYQGHERGWKQRAELDGERTAKAGPDEEACGKAHPSRPFTCQRRARHDVCVSWQAGNGADAWTVDYDDLVRQINARPTTGETP